MLRLARRLWRHLRYSILKLGWQLPVYSVLHHSALVSLSVVIDKVDNCLLGSFLRLQITSTWVVLLTLSQLCIASFV